VPTRFPIIGYHQVLEADFTEFKTPGEYESLSPPGPRFPFLIGEEWSRGLCAHVALGSIINAGGHGNELPYSIHSRLNCPTAPAEDPPRYKSANSARKRSLKRKRRITKTIQTYCRPNEDRSQILYPFIYHWPKKWMSAVDTTDAGGFYTVHYYSAAFIHNSSSLDVFPWGQNSTILDMPVSGWQSDILQEAKWERIFLRNADCRGWILLSRLSS